MMRRSVVRHVSGRFLDLGTENPRGGLGARRSCLCVGDLSFGQDAGAGDAEAGAGGAPTGGGGGRRARRGAPGAGGGGAPAGERQAEPEGTPWGGRSTSRGGAASAR